MGAATGGLGRTRCPLTAQKSGDVATTLAPQAHIHMLGATLKNAINLFSRDLMNGSTAEIGDWVSIRPSRDRLSRDHCSTNVESRNAIAIRGPAHVFAKFCNRRHRCASHIMVLARRGATRHVVVVMPVAERHMQKEQAAPSAR
jgi:hypothetical protein